MMTPKLTTPYEETDFNRFSPRTEFTINKGNEEFNLRDHINTNIIFSTAGASGFGSQGFDIKTTSNRFENITLSKILNAKTIKLPLFITGRDHNAIQNNIDKLDRILNAYTGSATLRYGMLFHPVRMLEVHQTRELNWRWGDDTNSTIYAMTELELKPVKNYWKFEVLETAYSNGAGVDDCLIRPFSFVNMRIGSCWAGGTLEMHNEGTLETPTLITVTAPVTRIAVTDPDGNHFEWNGELPDDDYVIIDSENETVVNSQGESLMANVSIDSRFIWLKPGWHKYDFVAYHWLKTPIVHVEYQARYTGAF
jgi:phage-related protein